MSNYTLLSTIFDAVHKDAYDGHLHYWLRGDTGSGRAALHRSSKRTTPYILLGRVTNISRGRSTGKRVTWEQKPGGILYVKVWEIGQRDQNGKWSPEQEQLLKLLAAIPSDQKLIIDYRGTQTGDSTFVSLLARTLYSKAHPPTGLVGTQKMSLYTRAGQVSVMNQVIFDLSAFGSSTQSAADNIRTCDQVQQLLDHLESSGYTMETMNRIRLDGADSSNAVALRNTDLSKPVLVITDGYCGSGCGMALAELRNHPMVKFIGNNSAGNLHFMSPGTFMLPHSRIKLTLSPTGFSYTPEFNDVAGFTPDLYTVGTDPVDAAIKYLGKF